MMSVTGPCCPTFVDQLGAILEMRVKERRLGAPVSALFDGAEL
jgi:hypothetical protein